MKKLLFIFLLLSGVAHAQYIKQANSVFNGLTVFPGITVANTLVNLNGATSLLPNPDTIRANSMQIGSRYTFKLICQSTTPTISIPTLTVRVVVGGNTMTLTNGVSLVGTGSTIPFEIMGEIWIKSSTQMIIKAKFDQSNGTIINLPITSMTPIGNYTPTLGSDMTFNITAQYGGISLGTTSLTPLVFHREIYQ